MAYSLWISTSSNTTIVGSTLVAASQTFPVVVDRDLGGGFRVVADIATRNAIVGSKRTLGMLVFCVADSKYYRLTNDPTGALTTTPTTNTDWTQETFGVGTGSDLTGDVTTSGGISTANTVIKVRGIGAPVSPPAANQLMVASSSSQLTYALLVDANVDAAAAISGNKINPNFGTQTVTAAGVNGNGATFNLGTNNPTVTNINIGYNGMSGNTRIWNAILDGYTNVVNQSNSYVADRVFYLNRGATTAPTTPAGISVDRGATLAASDGYAGLFWINDTGAANGGYWSATYDLAGDGYGPLGAALPFQAKEFRISGPASGTSNLLFLSDALAPKIYQADPTAPAAGKDMLIQAQNANGSNNGGKLSLTSGTGTVNGNIELNVGGTLGAKLTPSKFEIANLGQRFKFRNYPNTGSVNISVSDYCVYYAMNTIGAPITVDLPAAPQSGDMYVVKGDFAVTSTNSITIRSNGGTGTIDGSSTYVMDVAYQSITFAYNGAEWFVF